MSDMSVCLYKQLAQWLYSLIVILLYEQLTT